jgi:hypothetical protein
VALLLCLAAGQFLYGEESTRQEEGLEPSGIWVTPRVRPFRPTLALPGQVECPRTDEVMSHYRWWTNIKWMAPEGSRVDREDVVAIVFHEDLERIARESGQTLAERKAELAARREGKKLHKLDRQRSVRKAERTLREAEFALRKLERGPEPEELRIAELEIEKARAELEAAERAVRRAQMLDERGSPSQEQKRRLLHEQKLAAARLEAARLERAALKNRPTELKLLAQRAAVSSARAAWEAARRDADAERRKEEAEITQWRLQVNGMAFDFQKWQSRVRALERRCGMAGLVLWEAAPGDASVWPGVIATVIDPTVAIFVGRATEEQVARIAPGQQCHLELPALPGSRLSGQVAAVAVTGSDLATRMRFGEQEEWQESGVRVYDVAIHVSEAADLPLYQGLTGKAFIPVDEQTKALVIPRACVSEEDGRARALVWEDDRWVSRELELGAGDERYVTVVSGVEADDRIAIPREAREPK